MKKFIMLILIFLDLSFHSGICQYVSPPAAGDIMQSLKKLNTLGSVLYIAAHPDDENTRLLAYMAKEKNLRTGYLSITRGDGGQNLVGKEQGELLGLIRTQELLAARRIDGAEQFFTRANDFGYSKNPEETFHFWNRDSVLADVVWVIRKFKPDVIICRFPTTGEGGHGHHTASAILAVEAFDAAANPKMFPEQLAFTEVWQTRRIFFNAFRFSDANTTSEDQLKLDVGAFNPLLGKGYGEIAAESRSNHKSQGFGSARLRGSYIEFFKQLKGDTAKSDLFENMDQSWKRLPGAEKIKSLALAVQERFNPDKPAASVPELINLYKLIQAMSESTADLRYWKSLKLKETESLIISCSGLWMEAAAGNFYGIPGDNMDIAVTISNRNGSPAVVLNKLIFFNQTDTVTSLSLKPNELITMNHQEAVPGIMQWSSPYWLKEKQETGMYHVGKQELIGKPENEQAASVAFELEWNGFKLRIEKPLIFKSTDPVKGEVYRPFEILPPATVNITDKILVFPDGSPRPVQFTVKANKAGLKGKLKVDVPAGWNLRMNNPDFDLKEKGDEIMVEGTLFPGANAPSGKMHASLLIDDKVYTKSIQRIEYDHIPYQFILNDAETKLVRLNLKTGKGNLGYIPGAGDEIPSCLKQLGYTVTTLTDEMLVHADLSSYSAIITGIRAYNTNDRLQVHYQKLMEYVKHGGNLVVQYNTNNRIGPVQAKIGPYPFTISRDRVTDEHAKVTITQPSHQLLNYPNKIDSTDFDGWIQERGIYFASERDNNYEAPLAMNDPGEKELSGSLITARYGKGNFVYTGLVFFRELPAGVPGAYRLFVNLISLPPLP